MLSARRCLLAANATLSRAAPALSKSSAPDTHTKGVGESSQFSARREIGASDQMLLTSKSPNQ